MAEDKLYHRVAIKIEEDLSSHKDGLLPSVQALAKVYDVSPLTIWRAVRILVEKNLVEVSQGKRARIKSAPESKLI